MTSSSLLVTQARIESKENRRTGRYFPSLFLYNVSSYLSAIPKARCPTYTFYIREFTLIFFYVGTNIFRLPRTCYVMSAPTDVLQNSVHPPSHSFGGPSPSCPGFSLCREVGGICPSGFTVKEHRVLHCQSVTSTTLSAQSG